MSGIILIALSGVIALFTFAVRQVMDLAKQVAVMKVTQDAQALRLSQLEQALIHLREYDSWQTPHHRPHRSEGS